LVRFQCGHSRPTASCCEWGFRHVRRHAFLAEHAIAHDDGRFYALGGGLEHIEVQEFPAVVKNLTLLVRLGFDDDESGRIYPVELAGIGPDGKAFIPAAGVALRAGLGGRNRIVQFAHQLGGIQFPAAGEYHFSIRGGGVEMSRIEVRVEQAVPTSPEDTLTALMAKAYAAFEQGDLEEAKRLFQVVSEQFSESAEAHNNLGFVRLVTNDAPKALESFEVAERIGYFRPQILRANIACCWYLLGRVKEAQEAFASLVGGTFAAAGTTLVAIGKKSLRVITLSTPTDFVVLMALNAGRAAIQAGDPDAARAFFDISRAGEFSPSEATAATFATLRGELAIDLGIAQKSAGAQ
jgi:hypothetical protein